MPLGFRILVLLILVWMVVVTVHRLRSGQRKHLGWMWAGGVVLGLLAISTDPSQIEVGPTPAPVSSSDTSLARQNGISEGEARAFREGVCRDAAYRSSYPSSC